MTPSGGYTPPADHEKRMRAAEAVSQWQLGHRSWAQMLIGAYMNPDEAMENLRRERGDDDGDAKS